MNPVYLSIYHRAPRIVGLVALVALVCCAVVLLVSVAPGLIAAAPPPTDGPLLAPFRWAPLAGNLA